MAQMEGTVTIVQEQRFQLTDDEGVSHLFILSHGASTEPDQLADLQRRQARVRIRYSPASNLIGLVARAVDLVDGPSQEPGP
jgi:hypothetical protein